MAKMDPGRQNVGLEPAIAERILMRAAVFPGGQVLDLGSRDGFLAAQLADHSPSWTLHAVTLPDPCPENVEPADLEGPSLPFEDGELAGVVGAALDGPLEGFTPALCEELHRVMASDARICIAFRAPAARGDQRPRTLPEDATALLTEAGFEDAMETWERSLPDGSEVRQLRAVRP